MSDFSLMGAIKWHSQSSRVPVAENIPERMPTYRNLWENIRRTCRNRGAEGGDLDPLKLPTRLQTALDALYGHYAKTFEAWRKQGIDVPPCFIIVCQNTSISKLVYDYISGFHRENADGTTTFENGRLELFRNFDDTTGNPLPIPNTILVDSEQLETGGTLDKDFRKMASHEIERFRREIVERTGDLRAGEEISDQDLLREVMNTVGKPGQLGGKVRCVVSVSMLTEGWDANTVTHILGIRAFGTQLLCEQVSAGRSDGSPTTSTTPPVQRRVRGHIRIPFDFTAKPVVAPLSLKETAGDGRSSGEGRLRDSLPEGRGIQSRSTPGGAGGHLHRGIQPRAQPRNRRPIDHTERRHHRRRSGHRPWTPRRNARFHPPISSDHPPD